MTWASAEQAVDLATAVVVTGAAEATGSSNPSQQGSCPRIGWDMSLHPKELHAAYWREQAHKYSKWDAQVAWFLAVMVLLLGIRQWNVSGLQASLYSFAPSFVTLSIWISALRHQPFYIRHRVPLLTVIKIMLLYETVHATNSIKGLLYLPGPLSNSGSPLAYLLITTVLVSNVAHFPGFVAALPLPLGLQLAWTSFMAFCLLLSACPREMVTLSSIPVFQQALETSNTMWARLVQSGQPPYVQPDDSLHNRSPGMTNALLVIYSTCVAMNMYLAYYIQWIELRGWIRNKARLAAAAGRRWPPPAEAAAAEARCVSIEGVQLTQQQLRAWEKSPGAALLLDGRGVLGRAAMFCLHACVINMLLLAALLFSQILVLQIGPQLLPESVLAMYYPLKPEVAGDMCRPGDEPRYEGWVGWLLWALQR